MDPLNNDGSKPKADNVWNKKSLLTVSKDFLKSIQIIFPSMLYLSENSITSSIVLTASRMVLPLT